MSKKISVFRSPKEDMELETLAELSLRSFVEQSENGKFIIAENSGHYISFDRREIVFGDPSHDHSNTFQLLHELIAAAFSSVSD